LGYLQTWLLYHNALSRGVEIDHILQYARKNKDKAGVDTETVVELRNRLAEQEKRIEMLVSEYGSKVEREEHTALNARSTAGYGSITIKPDSQTSVSDKSVSVPRNPVNTVVSVSFFFSYYLLSEYSVIMFLPMRYLSWEL
jgi:hypothetical protein